MSMASALGTHRTDITDWERNYGPDTPYAAQVCEVAKRLIGRGFRHTDGRHAAQLGRNQRDRAAAGRRSARGLHAALRRAHCRQTLYTRLIRDGPGYRRFIAFSLWRALSPPPQDMPLALCEGRSVRDDEGTHNTKVDVDEIPTGDALFAPIEGEENMAAATIFHHSPRSSLVVFPGHDAGRGDLHQVLRFRSPHSRGAARTPRFAIRAARMRSERRSIEFRGDRLFSKS